MQQDNFASNEEPVLVPQDTDVQQVNDDDHRISSSFGNFVPSNDSNGGGSCDEMFRRDIPSGAKDATAAATNRREDTPELPVIQPADDTATTFASNESNVSETLRSSWRTLLSDLRNILTSWSHCKKVLRKRRNVAYIICFLLAMLLVWFPSLNKIFDVLEQILMVYRALSRAASWVNRNRRNIIACIICLVLAMLLVVWLLSSWNKIFDVLDQICMVYGAFSRAISYVDLIAQFNYNWLISNGDEVVVEHEVEDEETATENAASSALNEVIIESV